MLHKAGKPEDLVGSYRPFSLTSCPGKLLEKAVADKLSNWAEPNKKINKQQNGFRKNRSPNDNLFTLFETIKFGFYKVTQLQVSFLILRRPSTKSGMMGFFLLKLTSMGLNRKLIR